MNELWKDVDGYEGLYQISNYGNIRRILDTNRSLDRMLKIQHHSNGYQSIVLYKNNKGTNKLIHRLVAIAFIQNTNKCSEVNHIDGNKDNNHVDNLEWCTSSENKKHAYQTGLKKHWATGIYGGNNPKAKTVRMIDKKTNELVRTFGSLVDARNFLGIKSSSGIVRCCKGELKSTKGYKWEYANGRER